MEALLLILALPCFLAVIAAVMVVTDKQVTDNPPDRGDPWWFPRVRRILIAWAILTPVWMLEVFLYYTYRQIFWWVLIVLAVCLALPIIAAIIVGFLGWKLGKVQDVCESGSFPFK